MKWRYELIPEEIKQEVRGYVRQENLRELLMIHNRYKLSDATYCCPNHSILEHFRYGIKNGLI